MNEKVFCEQCDKQVTYYKNGEIVTREVKDLSITLKVQVPRCIKCKQEVFAMEVEEEVQKQFFDEYRRLKGLVFVEEIIEIRTKLGISQRDLARLLGLGEITITRYELGSLPSKSSSMIIQSLRERENIQNLYQNNIDSITKKGRTLIQSYLDNTDPIKFTGNVQYSKEKFSQLTAFFVKLFKINDEPFFVTKLNKLMFYTDFNYHKKMGLSITGSKYCKLSYGPVPSYYSFKYDMNPYLETVNTEEHVTYVLNQEVEYTELSEEELVIAEAVYKYFLGKNGKYISKASHEEDAWRNTIDGEDISYDLSETLKITV